MVISEVIANPYIGPRTFNRTDAARFFGREHEARNLCDTLAFSNLVLFYAQSGAGKSSLINARVIPNLAEDDGYEILPIGRVGGEIPADVEQVANIYVFNLMLSLAGNDENPRRFATMSLADFLLDQLAPDDAAPIPETGEVPHRLLIIDQFEEILTAHPDLWADRADFFRQLGQAMKEDPYLHVLLALREEYVAALDPYAPLVPGRLRARFYMERMDVAAALDAIRGPARYGGRPFATGAAEKLVDDLSRIRVPGQESTVPGPSVEPVQLQVVCYQLWENLSDHLSDLITVADIQAVGDVDSALTSFYEAALDLVVTTTEVTEGQLRSWFDNELITPAGTRGLVFRGETHSGGLPNAAVDQLAQRFLIRTEVRAGGVWVELVNDRFVDPIRQSNAVWRSRDPLVGMARAWSASGRPEMLLSQDQLTKLVQGDMSQLDPEVAMFVTTSRETAMRMELEAARKENSRAIEQRKIILRQRIVIAILALLSLIATVVAVWDLATP